MTVLWPVSPSTGDIYVFQGRVWKYNGTGWRALSGPTIEIRERRHQYVAPYSYCGTAAYGSSESAVVWEITRIEVLGNGNTNTPKAVGVAWTNRLTVTYS